MFRRLLGNEEGVIAPTAALLLVALVGFCALVLDFGTIYANRRALQNAADAAALAGAKEVQAQLLGGSGSPAAQAQSWASMNGVPTSGTSCASDGRPTLTYNGPNGSVPNSWQIDTSRLVNLNFGPVIGVSTMCVAAHAVAVVTNVSEPKIFPWALLGGTKLPPYAIPGDTSKSCRDNPTYCLELTTTNSRPLDFTCAHNSQDYAYWWRNGFGSRPGEIVPAPGTSWSACGGPSQDNQDIQQWINDIMSNPPQNCWWIPPQPNFQCPLMGMLPIVKETTWPNGSGKVTIVSLQAFKVIRIVSDGNGHLDVVGHIIQRVDGVGPGGIGQTLLPPSDSGGALTGPTGIRLIQ
jgi:Flp pilus assembly protein TadG